MKKIGTLLLLAAGLYMGTAAFGSTLGAAGGNMFSWGNFSSGAKTIGSSIFGGGSAAAAGTSVSGIPASVGAAGKMTGTGSALSSLSGGAAGAGNIAGVSQGTGIFNFIKSAMKDSPAMSLMAFSSLLGTGLSTLGAALDTSEEDALAESKRQFDINRTYAGFAPGSTEIADLSPDSPFFRQGPSLPSSPSGFQMASKSFSEPGFGRQSTDTTFMRSPRVASGQSPSILGSSGQGMLSGNDPLKRYT